MQYCPNCHILCEGQCPLCGNRRLAEPEEDSPVRLAAFEQPQAGKLEQMLQKRAVPYEKRSALSAENKPAYHFYVPFCRWEEAVKVKEIAVPQQPDVQKTTEQPQKDQQKPQTYVVKGEEFEVMPRKKRVFWRAFSVVLFILIVIAVVLLSDQAAGWLKNLFA